MQIGVFSDCHMGYKFGEERGEDSFIALSESLGKFKDCDLILNTGDFFDTRVPKPEVFAKVARILSKVQEVPSRTKFVEIINKEKHELSPLALRGIPLVIIHGTHERRSKFLVNPIQALEHAGLLIHLHLATAVFEIDGRKVAVHGMSGVPERYAKEVLMQWNPKPVPDAVNIFLIHQSISPYIYSPLEPPSLTLEDLPKGFDLYVSGHIHWHEIRPLHTGKFLICGSTITTSAHKSEAEQKKTIYKYDGNTITSIPLENQRKVIWNEFEFNPAIKSSIENVLSTIPISNPKPLVYIKVKGQIPKDSVAPSFAELEEKYRNRAIININKDLTTEGFQEQVEFLRDLREQKLSPEEHGLKLLQKNLQEINCGLKIDEIFDHLVEGNSDMIFDLLMGRQKTLGAFQ